MEFVLSEEDVNRPEFNVYFTIGKSWCVLERISDGVLLVYRPSSTTIEEFVFSGITFGANDWAGVEKYILARQ